MFVSSLDTRTKRRGVVLVLILGMLGLLALIGVTFATFSNQSQINARNFSQSASFPDPNEVMDFALAQLINDTANPQSVIRGHSLKRDMYGADAANNGALLNGMPDGSPMTVTAAAPQTSGQYAGMVLLTTNIPANAPALYGYDFTRWVLTFPAAQDTTNHETYVARTHEIIVDLPGGDGNHRQLLVAAPNFDIFQATGASAGTLKYLPPYDSPLSSATTLTPMIAGYTSIETIPPATAWQSTLTTIPPFLPSSASLPAYTQVFTLDGRFLRAFNGPGLAGMNAIGTDTALLANSSPPTTPVSRPLSEYANFRYNGNIFVNVMTSANPKTAGNTGTFTPGYGDPNFIPVAMDEDYDAVDLENWFLAMQSADGKVAIPSFHRPGIVAANDWVRTVASAAGDAGKQLMATRAMSRILRPRQADGHSSISFPDLIPGTNGSIKYDIDNDGDGATDSVWLDLGYPPKRSPEGQLFKPLFAFMVIGLNGRLPLNTAGNLQARDKNLQPTFDHAEHLGNSPSEIDLKFALQNAWAAYDATTTTAPYQQADNAGAAAPYDSSVSVSLTQLRNVLAGTRPWISDGSNGDQNQVMVNNSLVHLPNGLADVADNPTPTGPGANVYRNNPPVAGRWGESTYVPGPSANPLVTGPAPATSPPNFTLYYNNAVRAGFSAIPFGGTAFDARDDNFNAFDYNGEGLDYYDAAGALALPVERIRRYVTPADLDGNGRVITFNSYTYNVDPTKSSSLNNGADIWGRVSFFRYFRPTGLPFTTFGSAATTIPNIPAPLTSGTGAVWYDKGPLAPTTHPYYYDVRTNNPYHAFVASLTPDYKGIGTNVLSGLSLGGMPTDETSYISTAAGTLGVGTIDVTQTAAATPITPPTYSYYANSNPGYVSPGLNEADEMNLYTPNGLDAPFGPGDLEWLYRYQDIDGASLSSRLQYLAPISFLNPGDGARRRRLFCLDTWEPTNFVWANDNPQGVFGGNSRFNAFTSASFANMYNMGHTLNPDPAADFAALSNSSNGAPFPVQTPSLAHRDRRINLNYPLPVSNSPIEPLRQKWVRETYQLLKAVLPPRAVDTPEELAQLSQYVVNMVDFRDPDATMTRFVNTDVWVTEPPVPATGLTTTQATLAYTQAADAPTAAFDPMYTLPTYSYNKSSPATTVGHYLVQYGMEYQPVAINEVLAYQYQSKFTAAATTNAGSPLNNDARMLFELVNTLTKDAITGNNPDSSDLDLVGWDFVVLPDDAYGRPDPFTGQVPITQPGLFLPMDSSPTPKPVLNNQPFVSIPAAGGSLLLLSAEMKNVYSTPDTSVLQAPTYGGVAPPLSSLLPTSLSAVYKTIPSATKSADNPNSATAGQVYYYVFGDPLLQQMGGTVTTPVYTEATPPKGFPGGATFTKPTASTTNTPPATDTTPPFPATFPAAVYGNVDLTGLLTQRAIPPAAVPALPPTATGQTPAGTATATLNPGYYYWLYLRRPANPFDPTSDKVVVDSFRFIFQGSRGTPYTSGGGDQVADGPGSATNFNPTTEYMFSLERMQPFRGGHAIPPLTQDTSGTSPLPFTAASTTLIPAYGYSEQTAAAQSGSPGGTLLVTSGQYGTGSTQVQTTGAICHTLGVRNAPVDTARDYVAFNDRDYTSVIEMLTVPSCSPGLFTKQFAEAAPPLQPSNRMIWPLAYGMPAATWPKAGPLVTNTNKAATTNSPRPTTPYLVYGPATTESTNGPFFSPWPMNPATYPAQLTGNGAPHSIPYLNDEFYYTGASEPTPPADGSTFPSTTAGWVQNENIPSVGGTPPVTVPFRSPWNGNYIGGPGGAGFHKMLDFFEVPSPAFHAIGEVTTGVNYDWARQDLRPGLINLNLIIDEEVFFGLMGSSIGQYLNQGQIGMPGSTSFQKAKTPSVVTQIDDTGTVISSFHMANVGFYDSNGFTDPSDGKVYPVASTNPTTNALMKACFADFLSLRHGGTGFVFGDGNGGVGQVLNGIAAERPFHSLSYPDINYTILRPAVLPPSGATAPNATTYTLPLTAPPTATTPPAAPQVAGYAPFVWDPGIKNPYLFVNATVGAGATAYTTPSQPPPIPPRRLFQVADAYGSPGTMTAGSVPPAPPTNPTVATAVAPNSPSQPSNASVPGDPTVNVQSQLNYVAASPTQAIALLNTGTGLTTAYPDLTATPYHDPINGYSLVNYLGGQFYKASSTPPWPTTGPVDQGDHPYFRTEWLQKVANLTTVRTHQYAVWITVGFFEVTNAGDPSLAATSPFLAYDQLGNELGYLDGKNTRYRGFFLVDRTRATGFNPFQPDDFRGCVVYRQLIE